MVMQRQERRFYKGIASQSSGKAPAFIERFASQSLPAFIQRL
jgi:hypothetical protein